MYFLKEFIIVNETLNLKHRKKEEEEEEEGRDRNTHTHTHTHTEKGDQEEEEEEALKSVATEERERERREHGFRPGGAAGRPSSRRRRRRRRTIIGTKTQEEKGKTHPREGVSRPSPFGAHVREIVHASRRGVARDLVRVRDVGFFRFRVEGWPREVLEKKSERDRIRETLSSTRRGDRRDGLFRMRDAIDNAGRRWVGENF